MRPVFAAPSDAHEGHQPRFLHENPTTRSMPHDPQWTRKSPRDRTPHPRKARNSRSTKRGTSCSADRCSARNVSNSEATTLYRIVCSGDRISYNGAAADMQPLSQAVRLCHLCDICNLSPKRRKKSRKSRTMFPVFPRLPRSDSYDSERCHSCFAAPRRLAHRFA